MGVCERGEGHGDLELGDSGAKVFAGPSGGSSEDKAVERGWMHNSVKDLKCFFLRFVRVKAQYLDKRLEVSVPEGREARWQGRKGVGSKKVEIMKGPFNALENVRGNAFEKVVCEAIVCTEKASSDRLTIPARVRQGIREIAFQREVGERGDKDAPSVSPA